jgi:hypothetical protein
LNLAQDTLTLPRASFSFQFSPHSLKEPHPPPGIRKSWLAPTLRQGFASTFHFHIASPQENFLNAPSFNTTHNNNPSKAPLRNLRVPIIFPLRRLPKSGVLLEGASKTCNLTLSLITQLNSQPQN